jgi:teichuronic acid biosynthesis glycosyltransferase TuaH
MIVATDTRKLVWVAPTPWDGVPGTDRPMAMAMTRYARVLWVDPPVSAVTPARVRGDVSGGVLPSLSAVGEGITRLSTVALPGLTRPGIRVTTAPLLRAQVSWALRRLRMRPDAVVAGYLEDVFGRWDGAVNVLYSTDDHVAGAGLMGLSADRIKAQERRAVAGTDVIAVVSPQLADHWSALGADPVLIPNGCYPAYGDVQPAAAGLGGLSRPVAGLIGHLSERINLDILTAVADAGISLLIVGPHDPRWEPHRFAALTARSNVRYVGRVPAEAVPSYLAAIDVGLTPYGESPFNRASFPMKTLEYFSAGRPSVCTDLPGSRWLWDDLVRTDDAASQLMALASNPADVVAAVRALVGEPGDPAAAGPGAGAPDTGLRRAERCQAFAARHTWAKRADAMAAAIGFPAVQEDRNGASALIRGR